MRTTINVFNISLNRISLPLLVEMVCRISISSLVESENMFMVPDFWTQYNDFEFEENNTLAHGVNLSISTRTFVSDGFCI